MITRAKSLRGVSALLPASAIGSGQPLTQEYPNRDIHLICGFPFLVWRSSEKDGCACWQSARASGLERLRTFRP